MGETAHEVRHLRSHGPRRRRSHRQFDERLRLIELYEKSGFHAYHLAEHHATPLGMAPSPSVFLAAVAQRTKTLRFGPLVYTVNLYHPLRLIDEICMLDQMSGGRLELGIGRGISPYEVGYYGVDPATGPERFAEALEVILKGLTQKRLDHEGKYFTFKDVPMEMAPVQRPHPPLWYGANSLESADRLAKQALQHRGRHEGRGRRPVRRPLPRRLEGAGQERGGHAADRAQPPHRGRRHRQGSAERRQARLRPVVRRADPSLARPRRRPAAPDDPRRVRAGAGGGYIVAGSPATVRERLKRDNDVAGINYCLCRLAFGDLSFEESKRSVELFSREVMPAL